MGVNQTISVQPTEKRIEIDEDQLNEECGVFGIFGTKDASALTTLGLHALQHRGQEACGIASYDTPHFYTERHMGLVGDFLTRKNIAERLSGNIAIGHVRYTTEGGTVLRNTQPLFADYAFGGFAIAHNGHLTNARFLREELVNQGAIFQSTSDSEIILHLVASSKASNFESRFIESIKQIEGGYALIGLTNNKLIGARDPNGIRPLVLGDLNGSPVLSSETCALDMIGASYVRDVNPGEVLMISKDGIQSINPFPNPKLRPCLFEFVYFARPDSFINGKNVYELRKKMGHILAKEHFVEADVIIPVPDSGVPAALGFSEQSNIPFEIGIIRNHYVGRTFIQPTQKIRDIGVRLKHSVNWSQIKGKRVVLVDDSIVRGTTSKKIVHMIREAGAKEIHFRSACPPIRYPDYYGINMPDTKKLIAANYTLKEICEKLKINSLGYLSIEGLYKAMGEKKRNDKSPQYSDHCFTGDYPTRLYDKQILKSDKQAQLSLLVDVA